MGLSHAVSEINGDSSRKSQNFPIPLCILRPAERGIRRTGALIKKLEWWATGPRKKFDDIVSRVGTIYQTDRRTDKRTDKRTVRTDMERQQRPRLCIAWRGKNQTEQN